MANINIQMVNPTSANSGAGSNVVANGGRQNDLFVSEIHGKWYAAARDGKLFGANVTAVTIPVVASGMVSVFTLWNPPSSGVMGEIVDTEIGQVLATTVVDAVGWYASTGSAALAGTFTTKTAALSMRVGDTPNNQILFYSAYTHSGTPTRQDIIGSFGAVTDAGLSLPMKQYDGRLLLPPGVAMSVAMSTAAGTASGLDISARWVEWAFTSV